MGVDVVGAVASMAGEIESLRDQTESGRGIPDEILDALSGLDLFRLALPPDLGGPALDPVTALGVYETLARSEASVAWAVWNSSLPCLFCRYLSDEERARVFGRPGQRYASSTRPTGRAEAENGNFRLTGRWSLVSGCGHADWIGLMCLVERDGEVETIEGAPHMRMAFVPSDSVDIIDTWYVGGLRGTGSHDVVTDGLEVPAARTFSPMEPVLVDAPIARMPIAATMSAGHASICLGIASRVLDDVVELGRTKVSPDTGVALPDRAANQFTVSQSEATLAGARGLVRDRLAAVWETARAGGPVLPADVAGVWSASVAAARAARASVGELYEVAGTSALYEDFPVERAQRDIHAAMQHIIVQRSWAEDAGRVLFGMEPTSPLFML